MKKIVVWDGTAPGVETRVMGPGTPRVVLGRLLCEVCGERAAAFVDVITPFGRPLICEPCGERPEREVFAAARDALRHGPHSDICKRAKWIAAGRPPLELQP